MFNCTTKFGSSPTFLLFLMGLISISQWRGGTEEQRNSGRQRCGFIRMRQHNYVKCYYGTEVQRVTYTANNNMTGVYHTSILMIRQGSLNGLADFSALVTFPLNQTPCLKQLVFEPTTGHDRSRICSIQWCRFRLEIVALPVYFLGAVTSLGILDVLTAYMFLGVF